MRPRPNRYPANPYIPGTTLAALWDLEQALRDFGQLWIEHARRDAQRLGRRLLGR